MKNSKEKINTRKSTKPRQAQIDIRAAITKSWPGEEIIREKAEEIYYQRIERGEYGTAEEDWFKAKEYLID